MVPFQTNVIDSAFFAEGFNKVSKILPSVSRIWKFIYCVFRNFSLVSFIYWWGVVEFEIKGPFGRKDIYFCSRVRNNGVETTYRIFSIFDSIGEIKKNVENNYIIFKLKFLELIPLLALNKTLSRIFLLRSSVQKKLKFATTFFLKNNFLISR